ncbi:MFS transporter [Facklamia lactis]|uniref:MFS transporter n=1 Tax=Facklamia lactis TaxID=2749967 RepID=UPI0018CCF270|nr:MFS transporter [Facklamia lactis]MBG9981199.1 MFS transporter [Facklamia lactis]
MKNISTLLLVASQFFSVIGSSLGQFLILLYILDHSHSATSFGTSMAVISLGRLLALPFGGVLADRFNQKKSMLLLDTCYLFLTIVLIFFMDISTHYGGLFLIIFVLGMLSAFETPVVQAVLPKLAQGDSLIKVNSMISAIGHLGIILAPVMGGSFYGVFTMKINLFICCTLFVFALSCEALLKIESENVKQQQSSVIQMVRNDLKEAANYLSAKKIILQVTLCATVLNLLIGSMIQTLIPYIARVYLGVGNIEYSILNINFGLGSLLGAIIYGAWSKKLARKNLWFLLFLSGICMMVVSYALMQRLSPTNSFWIMNGAISLTLIMFSMISVHLMSYVQVKSQPELIGRVMSFVFFLSMLMTPVGQSLYGWLAETINAQSLYILVLIVGIITILLSILIKPLMKKIRMSV